MAFEKIKNSPLRKKIEKMLVDGRSPREISRWCQEQGSSISYVTVLSYKKQEFNFQRAAIEEMELVPNDSEQIFGQGKRNIMADIRYCNKIIELAEKKIDEIQNDSDKIGLFKIFHDAAIKAMELKHRYAGGEQNETIINFNNVDIRELENQIKHEIAELAEIKNFNVKAISG